MRPMRVIIPTLSWLLIMAVPVMAQAVVPITVNVGGTIFSGNDTVNIPNGTYGGITITNLGAGSANVVAPNDNTQDRLEFRNARIRGAATNTEYKIVFEGTFASPPTGSTYYRIRGRLDDFVRPAGQPGAPAATNSWVKAVGWFEQPAGTWYQIANSVLTPTTGMTITAVTYLNVFSATHTLAQYFSNVSSGSRKLKGELFFRVANTQDELKIENTADALTVHSSPVPGPGEPDPCEEDGTFCGPVMNCTPISEVTAWESFVCRYFGKCRSICWSLVPLKQIPKAIP